MRLDLAMWQMFINQPEVVCRPFYQFDRSVNGKDINFYTDASGHLRMGGRCGTAWMYQIWDPCFIKKHKPSIQYLELFALVAGVLAWLHEYKNQEVILYCDNKSVRDMVNSLTSGCKNCMVLLRVLVLHCLKYNVTMQCIYVKSQDNVLADHLSRGRIDLFKSEAAPLDIDEIPTKNPDIMWPMSTVWHSTVQW